MSPVERDPHGFDTPAALGHPARAGAIGFR